MFLVFEIVFSSLKFIILVSIFGLKGKNMFQLRFSRFIIFVVYDFTLLEILSSLLKSYISFVLRVRLYFNQIEWNWDLNIFTSDKLITTGCQLSFFWSIFIQKAKEC